MTYFLKILKGKHILSLVLLSLLIIAGILGYSWWQISGQTRVDVGETSIASGVVPHHLLAKNLIEDFFTYISSEEKPEVVVLLSPDHFNAGGIVGDSFITIQPESQEFCGVKVDDSLIKNLSPKNNLIFNNSSVSLDHGITDLMPFVKKYFPESKIVPFIIPFSVSLEKTNQFANSLHSLTSSKTIVIASVDFSHYLPVSAAKFHDVKSIRTLINFEKASFERLEVDSWQALYIARAFATQIL